MGDWKRLRVSLITLVFALLSPAAFTAGSPLEKELEPHFKTKWMGVYTRSNQKCGFAKSNFYKKHADGKDFYIMEMDINLKINMLGKVQHLKVKECKTYASDGALVADNSEIETTMDGQVIMATKTDGTFAGNKLVLKTGMGGNVTTEEFEVPEETIESMLAPGRLFKSGKIGESVEIKTFQTMLKKVVVLKITLVGFEERVIGGIKTKVAITKSSLNGNDMSTDYTTESGELIETSFAKMFVMRVEDEKTAMDVKAAFDSVGATIIRVNKNLGDPRKVNLLKLRMVGINKTDILLDDNRQKYTEKGEGVDADQIVMLRTAVKPEKSPALPVKSGDAEIDKWLAASALAQSDSPEIQKKAKEIIGDSTDSFEAASKIQDWVYKNVQKVGVAAMSNSVEVLREMKGDCTEHSALFVGLCRAAGIPARQVVGIGYSASLGGFGYHAWGEVWTGKWVAMDPTWGENLADATHVKFAVGEDESLLSIMRLIGSLQIEVMEINGKE